MNHKSSKPVGLKRRNNLTENGEAGGSSLKRQRLSTETPNLIGRDHELISNYDRTSKIGIIEKIQIKNFMCHDNLECELSPKINLLQGRNGSGKSAVLTAVVVALGGTSRSTNRAASLKDLVQYGKQSATIEVTIANQGEGSYKYDMYGPSIRIERKINSSGGATYKIKDSRGNVKGDKRDDLYRLRDAFNLQVENPITILNQDKARSFLTSEDPATLFKLFMEATRMQNVKEDYNMLDGNVNASKITIEERKKYLPQLEKDMVLWKKKKDLLVTLNEKKGMEKQLREELCWAMVKHQENEMLDLDRKYELLIKNEKKYLSKAEEAEKKIQEGKKAHKELEKSINSKTEHHETEEANLNEVQEKFVKDRRIYRDERDKISQLKDQRGKVSNEVRALNKALNKDHDAERRIWQEKNNQRVQDITEIEAQIKTSESTLKTYETHTNNISRTLQNHEEQLQDICCEEKGYKSQYNNLRESKRAYEDKNINKFSVFGTWLPRALNEIEEMHQRGRFDRKPIGPLGAYVEVTNQAWAHIAEKALGNLMHCFRCHSWADCNTLKSIFSRHVKSMPNISVGKFLDRVYDVSRNETYSDPHGYKSLWSILNISDPVVANSIIDGAGVEGILLIPTAQEAGSILKNRNKVPTNCRQAYTLKGDKYLPDPNFRIYSGEGKMTIRYLHASVKDVIEDIQSGLDSCMSELENIEREKRSKQAEVSELSKELNGMNVKIQQTQKQIMALKTNRSKLNSEMPDEPLPADTHHLQEEMQALQKKLKTLEGNIMENEEQENKMKKMMDEAEVSVKEAKSRLDKSRVKLNQIKNELLMGQETTNQFLAKKEGIQKKAQEELKKANEIDRLRKKQLAKVDSTREDAEKITPIRVETERSVEAINKQLDSLTKRLKMECEKLGSVEKVTSTYAEKFKMYQKTKSDIQKQSAFIKKLQDGYSNRIKTFEEICKYHAIYLNTYFDKALRHRGLEGSVDIDFVKKLLHINICKKNGEKLGMKKGRKSNNNSLSMMSGGERSFVTVSFMLALWETIYSPLRMLDEFDVFMDVVSRNQSMDLMIQAAQPGIQYVYLTPLTVNKKNDDRITIFRMPDPVR